VAAQHDGVAYHVGDVSGAGQAAALVARTIDTYGRLDALVNNAGLLNLATVETITPEEIAELFRTNVSAPAQLLRAALPHLKATSGSVVNVTSAVAQIQMEQAFYGASKAALDYLTKTWAADLAQFDVRVNAVAPGPTDTGMTTVEFPDGSGRIRNFRLPLKRLGEPGEVARWIHLLAEPASGWVTGQIIAVDGGMTIA